MEKSKREKAVELFKEKQKKSDREYSHKTYEKWKKEMLENFSYVPIFKPMMDSFLLRDLSGGAMKLYIYLTFYSGNYTGETWVGIEKTSEYFNVSSRTISRWISKLQNKNLIYRKQYVKDGPTHTFLLIYGREVLERKIERNTSKEQRANEIQKNDGLSYSEKLVRDSIKDDKRDESNSIPIVDLGVLDD
ncbi:hypothetical protein QCD85_10035 [Paenibacillus sp. PsM32]|uniref:helix-turn-helix domain-containing protein n=1 Tax=Paenibacillus sp. PsM32 TaxID=3030536 RepID=UPI00263A9DBD|nr:helix-turn-helix domain-containing protein [Paenibacillus sp. PsM32]MDN4618436.1 hypothetical protein [Paenibacillus sp. PsM32]